MKEYMFNFNWGKRTPYLESMETGDGEYHPTPIPVSTIAVPKSEPDSSNGYTVGVNFEGKTVMKISVNHTISTLTMNGDAVRQMIKLLEATLGDEE